MCILLTTLSKHYIFNKYATDIDQEPKLCCYNIFQDYRQEFNRTKANLVSTMERRDLLQSVRRDITDFREGGSKSRMDLLLKESDHIRNSERLIDEQVNVPVGKIEAKYHSL